MYAIIHLATGIQINDTDYDEKLDIVNSGLAGYDPNTPEVSPKLYFKQRIHAAVFVRDNKFVLAVDENGNSVPVIGLRGLSYLREHVIPKYQIEIVEV